MCRLALLKSKRSVFSQLNYATTVLLTFDLDIDEVWVYTEGQVGGECPGGGGPGYEADRGVLIQGEIHNH